MPAAQVFFQNWHETVNVPLRRFEQVRNQDETNSTMTGYNETTARMRAWIRAALDEKVRLRAVGGGWSFSPVAATDGFLLGTQRLNYRFALPQAKLRQIYPLGRLPVFVQSGISIAELNRYLASRNQALPTSGASNGQTLAGALSTGTHGGAVSIGAVPDYVVGIHLAVSPDRTIWLERASYPVFTDEAIAAIGAEPRRDDELFDAALVSFGSFGLILGLAIEPVPLYYLHAWLQPVEPQMNGTSLWDAVAAMDFQAFQLPGASGRSPRHLEFLANPHIGGKLKVRVMYHSDTLPAGSHLPDASSKFGKGDSALDVIGTITDGWNSFTPFAAQLLELALAPYEQIGCTPGQMFKDSSTRGKSSSAAMGLPLNRAREAFELAVSIVASEKAPAIVAMRFVKSTRAILGFTRFSPVTAILEVDGAFSSGTTMAQQAVWAELAARNIPYTFHWGKVNNLDALSVRRCYGEERVRRWIDSRHKLLDTPELRRVFSNMFTDRLGLSD